MTRNFTSSFAVLTVLAGSLLAAETAVADTTRVTERAEAFWGMVAQDSESGTRSRQVVYKMVQRTQEHQVSRPEVPTGSRITLFANFLGKEKGCVTLNIEGTTSECEVVEWKDKSVTVELPKLGMNGPKNAEIQLVKPDGRIVKTFRIQLVPQPDILVHGETVPRPMPSASAAEPETYAMPVSGGAVFYSK